MFTISSSAEASTEMRPMAKEEGHALILSLEPKKCGHSLAGAYTKVTILSTGRAAYLCTSKQAGNAGCWWLDCRATNPGILYDIFRRLAGMQSVLWRGQHR